MRLGIRFFFSFWCLPATSPFTVLLFGKEQLGKSHFVFHLNKVSYTGLDMIQNSKTKKHKIIENMESIMYQISTDIPHVF